MNAGYLKKITTTIDGNEKSFTAGGIILPFLPKLDITLQKNKKEDKKESAPDFFIYMNKPKGWNGAKSRIGALWLEKIDKQDSPRCGEDYMRGHIETPMANGDKLYIAVFKAMPSFEGEKIERDYDILWSPAQRKANDDNATQTETYIPEDYENDDEPIPF